MAHKCSIGKPGKSLSNMAMLELLRGMRPGSGLTVHGLRSSFRDWAAETGGARDVAEAALAHAVRDKTERAYLRTDHFEARRPLMAAWADHCFGRVAPVKRQIILLNLQKFNKFSGLR
jgi:integrase